VRYRAKLTSLRTSAKAQIHAVMAKEGILPALDDMFGSGGRALIEQMPFDGAYRLRVNSLLELLDHYARELVVVEAELAHRLAGQAGYEAIQAIKGVGPIMAAIFVAEIGDVGRFPTARHVCSWAGLTPSHKESDTKVQRGHITKMACGARATARLCIPSGGDRGDRGRSRHSSSAADVRLCGAGHRRDPYRAGHAGEP
jgi:transposase